MQFSHVNDMTSEEILDYAVLYGNETSDLNIKSFNNMEVRDYIQDDWISIFIDLIVDILNLENPLILRTHATTKGEKGFFLLYFNSYSLQETPNFINGIFSDFIKNIKLKLQKFGMSLFCFMKSEKNVIYKIGCLL